MSVTITTRDALMDLPLGTVVRSHAGTIACRYDALSGVLFGAAGIFDWEALVLPCAVLWDPTGGAR